MHVVRLQYKAIHTTTVEVLKKKCDPGVTFMHNSILNELRGGELDKMTHAEIKSKYPEIWDERMKG